MHATILASVVLALSVIALGGCIDNDRVRVQSFIPGAGGSFTYTVRSNTVMTPNDDGAAEAIRREWLAQTLGAEGVCDGGYVIYNRELVVPPQRPALASAGYTPANADSAANFGNIGYVVYNGACL